MESKYKRIFITGASGVGKTTLGKTIENDYGLPFISTSAKDVWSQFGFQNHKQAHKHACSDVRVGSQYQHEVLNRRIKALTGKDMFVSDRSPFDNYSYYLMQIGCLNTAWDNQAFRKLCQDQVPMAEAVIYIKYPDGIDLKNDGFRIVNPDYQIMVDATIELSLSRYIEHDLPILEINTWDFQERLRILKRFLGV